MAENSIRDFTRKINSRNDYLAELNKMQALVTGAPQPQPQQQQQQQMPDFGAGGVALQQAKNEGLIKGLQQQALAGAGNDRNGWPLAAGPNPDPWAANNFFAGAHERSRAIGDAERAKWAEQRKAQQESIWAGLRGELPAQANPFLQRHLRPFIEQAADNSRKRQEANGWVFPNPTEQYGRSLKYGSPGMLPMDYRGPGIYYAGAGPDDPYEKWTPPAPTSIATTPGFPGASYYGDVTKPTYPAARQNPFANYPF